MKSAWLCIALAASFLCLSDGIAAADLRICNRTSYVLYAATATDRAGDIESQGWSRVTPGACRTAFSGALVASAYYVYARSSQAHAGPARAWGGDKPICVKDGNFSTRTASTARDCASDDFFTLPFAPVDTHRMTSWTMTLSETPNIATLDAARLAGRKRLLKDLGYKIASLDGLANGTADSALLDFRRKLHVSLRATDGDLFDALETSALKITAPAGYSICNDTAKPLAAAIGEKIGSGWISHGWWKIDAGSCATAITTPLAADSLYLFAQKVGGAAVVTGHAKFCVADIEFDIQGRTRCKDRGLNEIGFAETRVKGLTGYSAHIGDTGLLPAGYRSTSK
jgi:uncharacterized membrane protein